MPSGAARARKITNAGNRKVIGKFPSLKMNAVISWESQLERDYIYLLEIDPEVLSYGEQPFTISYTDNMCKLTLLSVCTYCENLAHNLKRDFDTGTVALTPWNGGAICFAAALALSLPPRDSTPALKAHILAESDRGGIIN